VRIGKLWIGPSWYEPPADATAVVLDPGRAFGTGAHPTTRLCVELLLEQERSSVVDLGCGSGILAIIAAKLGFAPVVAIDSDDNAVAATVANAAANKVSVETRRADVLVEKAPRSELVLANITRPALEALAPRLRCERLVSSGYLPTDSQEIASFRHVRRLTRDGWAADLYEAAQ
jgi:ribosomal protein L11 methyltransferase